VVESGYRFRLFSSDGDALGEFLTAAPDWHPGDEFFTAQRRRFRILAIVDVDEPNSRYKGFFEVAPA
jgi:hypothetical protein